MKYMLIITNPVDEVEVIRDFHTAEAAWEEADKIDSNPNFSFDVVPDINEIIAAYRQCEANIGCDGCPYNGVCCTRSYALERDTVVALKAMMALVDQVQANDA